MKTVIEKETMNPYMKRKEVDITLEHHGTATPNKAVVQQTAAQELGSKLEKVEVKNIFSIGGEGRSKAKIFIWEEKKVPDLSKVVKEKAVVEGKKKEKAVVEGKKKEKAAVEEKKEQPAKGKREEKPKETKEAEHAKKEPSKE
ncbi:MAG: hypothetical protein HZB66_03655 [Candidatus Aenigmarchaeota archaeon]|nr:hypothetical protein [Candidatus Aenigmarchaeota archaeon]